MAYIVMASHGLELVDGADDGSLTVKLVNLRPGALFELRARATNEIGVGHWGGSAIMESSSTHPGISGLRVTQVWAELAARFG